MMKKNVGTTERVIRAIVGLVALGAAFTVLGVLEGATLGIVAAVVGVVMLFTASIGWCPPYAIFGINTCNIKSSD
ncbi:MAG: DUF2892 domain-containing protein [Gammaproteobacteria bacterium]|nr:DUF2892 domain-containing protein [Gammaproteobacteria bacterium]MBT4076081.1 DUF2892 domain-containing protein [Gammaproteobacteria bacterium]MBT4448903.1 DUF2892 domain-containing protein [Gammaproteobacteria bacterium]MBT4863133.1 DUF2892 domain-containing protein [Gammaproteobacteria bacterium]MBT6551622.1 DUF2892 domain-containing protein [Gammaproteobacteria bacterium]